MAQLAINRRTGTRAAIRRAEASARARMRTFDREALDELADLYREASADFENEILARADEEGSLQLSVLRELMRQIDERLQILTQARDALLQSKLATAAEIGVSPFATTKARIDAALVSVAHDAVQFVQAFVAEDGLQLSDRLWRIDQGAREALARAIQESIIRGYGAARATAEFLERGQPVPEDVTGARGANQARTVARQAGAAFMTDENAAAQQAARVFRTEINRAHGEAYRNVALAHPDAVGTRFLLSPLHPEIDICDMHAAVNLYGLGAGVYPPGASPWPAHPNTLSYEEVVYRDEVSAADKNGRTTRIEWLRNQPPEIQKGVLGAIQKVAALQRGILPEGAIATPWRVLKGFFEGRGFNTDEWGPASFVPPPPEPSKPLPDFRVSGSARAAAEWAREQNLADIVDYSGVHVDIANDWNKSIFDHLAEFPELRPGMKFIGSSQAKNRYWYDAVLEEVKRKLRESHPDMTDDMADRIARRHIRRPRVEGSVWAMSSDNEIVSGVTINDAWAKDVERLRQALRKNVENGFHPLGTDTVKAIIDHELGHQMDTLLKLSKDRQIIAIYENWRRSDPKGEQLSRYAQRNIDEFIAEAWSEYRNADRPRDIASQVAARLYELYRARQNG